MLTTITSNSLMLEKNLEEIKKRLTQHRNKGFGIEPKLIDTELHVEINIDMDIDMILSVMGKDETTRKTRPQQEPVP